MADHPTHWTDNEDVLERYVLGRIDAQTRRILDEHLEHCAPCREAVQRETELAAGVRLKGRDELKARLSQRLRARSRMAIPWPHVISAAAVLVIAVGVAIYAFWTPLETWYEEQMSDARPQQNEAPSDVASEEQGMPPSAGADAVARRNEALVERINRAKGAPEKLEQAPAIAEAAEPQMRDEDREDKDLGFAEVSAQSSAWVQGMIVQSPADKLDRRTNQTDAPAAPAAEMEAAKLRKTRQQEGASTVQPIQAELQQRPATSLPQAQQRLRLEQNGRAIETLLEKTPEGLRLTMYFDQPIPDEELQAARVEAVGADSLLVVMPTQQIAYKIPPSFGNLQGVQLKTK